ncbi:MAG: MBL fold metallo-hydrolase [Kiritimatiellia bacterium]
MGESHTCTIIQRGNYRVVCIPVLQDNFVYLVCRGKHALVIDAGAVVPVLDYLRANNLYVCDVLLTHRHGDHAAGYAQLCRHISRDVAHSGLGPVEVLSLPGHTADDAGFYFPDAGVVFTGDCLINGACGRVLGGSIEDLYNSLQRIKRLPADTLVLGGHDYLADNLRFGLDVDTGNPAIQARLARYASDPTGALFVPLAEEMASNPFLRAPDFAAFAALRASKDRY